ncbi:hypothetical protein KCU98_g191, partial [Aureobasidium melanogenum]
MNQIPRCHDFVAFRLCPAQVERSPYHCEQNDTQDKVSVGQISWLLSHTISASIKPLPILPGRIAPDGHHSTRHQSDRTSCVCPDLREWYERPRPDDNVPGAPESGWYSFTSS